MHAKAGLTAVFVVVAACSADAINSPTTGPVTQWIVDDIVIPVNQSQVSSLGFDLNGDGTVDNALGGLLAALASTLDVQAGVDAAVASGALVQLIGFQSDDATLTGDAAAGATWYVGQPTAGFTTGAHQVDVAFWTGVFVGALSASNYASANPATATQPVGAFVPLRLFAGTSTVYLPLNGVHVEWHFSGTTGIASGEIHGSIRATDINVLLVPALAEAINAVIQADTSSSQAHTLESLFDTGGCGAAAAGDMAIDVCEVATNSLIQSVLAPDVQIYNASGGYQPSAANTTRNALSVGLGFTAVRTTF